MINFFVCIFFHSCVIFLHFLGVQFGIFVRVASPGKQPGVRDVGQRRPRSPSGCMYAGEETFTYPRTLRGRQHHMWTEDFGDWYFTVTLASARP